MIGELCLIGITLWLGIVVLYAIHRSRLIEPIELLQSEKDLVNWCVGLHEYICKIYAIPKRYMK